MKDLDTSQEACIKRAKERIDMLTRIASLALSTLEALNDPEDPLPAITKVLSNKEVQKWWPNARRRHQRKLAAKKR